MSWFDRIMRRFHFHRIENLQIGAWCGLCGDWVEKEITEKVWPYTICDKCEENE